MIEKLKALYIAANELLAVLGAEGEVNNLCDEAAALLGALCDLDGGDFDVEKAFSNVSDFHVVVADNDKPHHILGVEHFDDGGPLVFEQYTRTADLETIKKRAKQLKTYGKNRIARLVFLED